MHMVAQETPATQVARQKRPLSPSGRTEALLVALVQILARQAAREVLASASATSQEDVELHDPAVEPGND